MITDITDEDMHGALDRIARSPDGELLYRYLQKVLCAVTTLDVPECALPRNEGRRSFAAELMGLMAEGMQDSGSRSAAVTFTRAKPRAVSGSRGAGRRITADTFVSGWDGSSTDAIPFADAESGGAGAS